MDEIIHIAIEQIDAFANKHGSSYTYRYLNYCGSWQKPLHSCGGTNLEFLKAVSQRYDPDGLFQRGCTGGFKLRL